jgi:hypothetical protein
LCEAKPDKVKGALKSMFSGDIQKVKIRLRFNPQWRKEAIYYLLQRLGNYYRKMDIKEIALSNNVFIGDKKIVASNVYSGASKFGNEPGRDILLKKKIDELIDKHLEKTF